MQKIKSAFYSSITHELRTPLNSIIPILTLVLQTLQKNPLQNEELINFVKIALTSSKHLQNVVEDALDITRLENGNFKLEKEHFDPRKLIKEEIIDVLSF